MRILSILAIGLILFVSCDPAKKLTKTTASSTAEPLEALQQLMTGTFTSGAQAQADSAFYDISLRMYPIWEASATVKWLYVEQAVTANLKQPYRQRVYRLIQLPDGQYESRVYELPEPERFIHAWENPTVFDALTPDQLVLREGCAVYLTQNAEGCFQGATKPNACGSTLRGASYATSEVAICPGQVISWDRGWNAQGEQVWGAEKSGYIFLQK